MKTLRFSLFIAVLLAIAFSLAAISSGAHALTTLTNSDFAPLRTAISQGGVIILAFDGTVKWTNNVSINADTTLDATGHDVWLDAGGDVSHFVVTNDVTLKLRHLGIINGRTAVSNELVGAFGGAIQNKGGSLELIDCILTNNSVLAGTGAAAYGGAIYSVRGHVSVTNGFFYGNSALGGDSWGAISGAYGGAIYSADRDLTLVGVTFTSNRVTGVALSAGADYGGALANLSDEANVSKCVFNGNQAIPYMGYNDEDSGSANGGAIYHEVGTMRIDGTLFTNNTAIGGPGNAPILGYTLFSGQGRGGALFSDTGKLFIQNTSFVSNQAIGGACQYQSYTPGQHAGDGLGGGIYGAGDLVMVNCTLDKNAAAGGNGNAGTGGDRPGTAYGGAVFVNGGTTSLTNVTMAVNSVAGGVRSWPSGEIVGFPAASGGSAISATNGTVSVINTIMFLSLSQTNQTNVIGRVGDSGHNISSDASAGFTSASSKNNVDPLLGPLANNGGFTPTLALLFGSPAIGAGDPAACPPTDQRGVARPMGSGCDIGAFEFSPTLSLTRLAGGTVRLDYQFEAGVTNRISGSTNLTNWMLLGTHVSDANGRFQWEDPDSVNFRVRFYTVQP
jgi:hypothetical protein